MEGVSGIVAHLLVAEHQRRMVHTHRHTRASGLKRTDHVDQARVEMSRLLKIARREHTADAGVDELGSVRIFTRKLGDVVVCPSTQRTGTEGRAVVRIGHGI